MEGGWRPSCEVVDYDTAELRQFLFRRFDDEELKQLCFDYFTDVYHDFTSGMRKSQMVQLLLEHCRKQGRFPALLAALERERPEAYADQFPAAEPVEAAAATPFAPIARNSRQVFISYAHQDVEFAQRLADDLRNHDLPVWIAPDSIRPGEKWVEAINRGLSECGIFALALTPKAVASNWVKNEVNVAIQLNNEGSLRFIPLQVVPADIPPLWRAYQYIPFGTSYETGLQALLAQLGVTVPEPQPPLPAEKTRDEPVSGRSLFQQAPRWAWAAAGLLLQAITILVVRSVAPAADEDGSPVASVTEPGADLLPAGELPAAATETTPLTPTADAAVPTVAAAAIAQGELNLWPGFLEPQLFQGEIRLGETVAAGRLAPGDVHTWLFRDGPAVVNIGLDGAAGADYLLRLYSEASLNWDDIYPRGYVDANGAGNSETLNFLEFPDEGDYLIAVSGSGGVPGRYELSVVEALPGAISFNETIEDSVVGDNPAVWKLPAGPAVVDITLKVGPRDTGLLILFDELGNQLEYIDQAGADGTITLNNLTVHDGEAYTIIVRDTNNDGAQYTLTTVERSASPAAPATTP
jgi:hypothetical protein